MSGSPPTRASPPPSSFSFSPSHVQTSANNVNGTSSTPSSHSISNNSSSTPSHGTNNPTPTGRRDRALSMITTNTSHPLFSTPQRVRHLDAEQAAASRRGHTRLASGGDWSLARFQPDSDEEGGSEDDSEEGDEDEEIEGVEVPFYTPTQYDSTPHTNDRPMSVSVTNALSSSSPATSTSASPSSNNHNSASTSLLANATFSRTPRVSELGSKMLGMKIEEEQEEPAEGSGSFDSTKIPSSSADLIVASAPTHDSFLHMPVTRPASHSVPMQNEEANIVLASALNNQKRQRLRPTRLSSGRAAHTQAESDSNAAAATAHEVSFASNTTIPPATHPSDSHLPSPSHSAASSSASQQEENPSASPNLVVATGSEPSTGNLSPKTRARVERLEKARPHTTSNAALQARNSGTNFHLPSHSTGPSLPHNASPVPLIITDSPTTSPQLRAGYHKRIVSSPSPPVTPISPKHHIPSHSLSIATDPLAHQHHHDPLADVDLEPESESTEESAANLTGIRKLAHAIRNKLIPSLHGKWSAGNIVRRFLTHKYGDFDVSSMLSQQFTVEEFRQRMAARLHHMNSAQTIAATTNITTDMFRSLKTFHQLLNGTSVLNAHLSKRQALQNIISTVHALLDAEKVTVFLLHKSKEGQVSLKAVSAVQKGKGERVLRPAEMTIAPELVSIVARTGELRNIRDCSSEPLCSMFADKHHMNSSAGHTTNPGTFQTPPSPAFEPSTPYLLPSPNQFFPSPLSSYKSLQHSTPQNNRGSREGAISAPVIDSQASLEAPSKVPFGINVSSPLSASPSSTTPGSATSISSNLSLGASLSSTTAASSSSHPFLTPQPVPNQSNRDSLTFSAKHADGGPPKALFDRAHSVGATPSFSLRNCLCVPVRGSATKESNGTNTNTPVAAAGHSSNTGKVVAVIQAVNKQSGPYFSSEDVQILQFIGLLAGQSLSNASLYEEALVRRRQQEALCTMIELMSAETGVDEVIHSIISSAYRLLDVDRISLYIVDESKNQLVCKVSKDLNAIGQRLPLRYGLIGLVAAEGKLINISDCANDPRCKDILTLDKVTGYTTKNILTLPIQDNKKRVAAVIQVINKKKGTFTLEDETLMQSLSRSAGQILRKAQLFSALLVEQRKTKALMGILQAEEGELSIESLLDRILHTAHDVIPCQKVVLYVVDAVREDLYALVADPNKGPASSKRSSEEKREGDDELEPTRQSPTSDLDRIHRPNSLSVDAASPSPTSPLRHARDSSLSVSTSSGSLSATAASSKLKRATMIARAVGNVVSHAAHPHTKHLSFPLKQGLAGWCVEHGRSLNIANAAADPRFDPHFDTVLSSSHAKPFRTRSSLCIPLHNTTGTTIAVLQAINCFKRVEGDGDTAALNHEIIPFSEEEEEIFRALCTQAGITLRRRLTEVLLGRSRRELGDDKQINSLFEIYGGNYLTPNSSSQTSGPFAGMETHAEGASPVNASSSERDKKSQRRKTLIETHSKKLPLHPQFAKANSQISISASPPLVPSSSGQSQPLFQLSKSAQASPQRAHLHSASRAAMLTLPAIPSSPTNRQISQPLPSVSASSSEPAVPEARAPSVPLSEASSSPSPEELPDTPVSATIASVLSSAIESADIVATTPAISPHKSETGLSDDSKSASASTTVSPIAAATTPAIDTNVSSETAVDSAAHTTGFVASNIELDFMQKRFEEKDNSHTTTAASASSSSASTALTTATASSTSTSLIPTTNRVLSASSIRRTYEFPVLSPSLSQGLDISLLQTLDFNVFDYSEDQLIHFSYLILNDMGFMGDYGFSIQKMQSFLTAVRYHYNDNPYHCYYHGFEVFQFAYWMLRTTEAGEILPRLEQFSLLIAAMCHDIDHPGTTNAFQIASQSDIALAHNDQAVLENHHCFLTFELLRDPNMNVLSPESITPAKLEAPSSASSAPPSSSSSVSTPSSGSNAVVPPLDVTPPLPKWTMHEYRQFRKSVISAILSTDMSKHFELCKKLDSMEPDSISLDCTKEEERQFMLDLLTHCADLSAQVLPYSSAVMWEERVTQEFIRQADLEQELNLPPTNYLQGLTDHTTRFKNHINFYDFVLSPLWLGMIELFPSLNVCVQNLLENRKAFMKRLPPEALPASHTITDASPSVSEPTSPSVSPPLDMESPGRRPSVDRSASRRVGLLRIQRGHLEHSPSANGRSNSFSNDDDGPNQKPAVDRRDSGNYPLSTSSSFTGETPPSLTPSGSAAFLNSSPSLKALGSRDPFVNVTCPHVNKESTGLCIECAKEQQSLNSNYPFSHDTASSPISPDNVSYRHLRKLSAPSSLTSSPNPIRSANIGGPHSLTPVHYRRGSLDDAEFRGSSAHSPEGGLDHHSPPESPTMYRPGSAAPNLPASSSTAGALPASGLDKRKMSLNIKERKAARWNALTQGRDFSDPVRALPLSREVSSTDAAASTLLAPPVSRQLSGQNQ